jgi:hypothetical protein
MMPWIAGASIASSLLGGAGGLLGGKSSNKAAKRAMNMIAGQQNQGQMSLQPFVNSGDAARQRLDELLGLGGPRGYAPAPTRQQYYNNLLDRHYKKYGGNLAVGSNFGWFNNQVEKEYQDALKKWEAGLEGYMNSGADTGDYGALTRAFTNEDFVQDPGYEFRQMEGEKGLNRAFASRGGYDSGAALKAINRYNQDYASNEFQNAYNRDSNNKAMTYNFLSGTANSGQGAATSLAGLGANAAAQAGNVGMQGAAQQANYQIQGLDSINNAIQSGIGNYLYQQRSAQTAPIFGSGGSSKAPPWYLT